MDNGALVIPDTASTIVNMVIDGLTSAHSKRAYARALTDFMAWYRATGQTTLSKATVQRYAAELAARGLSAANINQRLSAIRKLAREAADNGALPEPLANGIANVKGLRQEGHKTGRWLTRDAAQKLLDAPDPSTLKGLRDRAILAVLLGCGLRREELARLTFEHIRQLEGRWVIVDIIGKRNKTRSVPMPSWAKAAIDAWAEAAGISTGRVFRALNKGGRVSGDSLTAQAVRLVVESYAQPLSLDVAPHDLRRTFAKLAYKGGAGLDQIQLSLGHGSIQTTERYLGVTQDLTDAPCDRLGLKLENAV